MIGLPADYYPIDIAVELNVAAVGKLPDILSGIDFSIVHDTSFPGAILSFRNEPDLNKAVLALRAELEAMARFGEPTVAYRETITRTAEIDYTHKKQRGGAGEFARIKVRFEPLESGAGLMFASAIRGGAVPEEYIPGVRRGFEIGGQDGLIAGYPLTDFRATLLDGAWHDTDSTALAFEIAARGALRELKGKGDPRLMEPLVNLTLSAPETHAASVRQLLAQRSASEIVSLIDRKPGQLLFQVRLVTTLGLRQHLQQEAPGTELIAMQFSGMREVPRAGGGPQVT